MPSVITARVTLADKLKVLEDDSHFSIHFKGTGTGGLVDDVGVFNKLSGFLDGVAPGQALSLAHYLSNQIDFTGGSSRIDLTDITTHLDGTPAGPPYNGTPLDITSGSGATGLPPNNAACMGYRADYGTQLEQGPVTDIPTDDDAQDQGAPKTHPGKPRPRAGLRGRIFIGPLSTLCLSSLESPGTDAGLMATQFTTDLKLAFNTLCHPINPGAANETTMMIWTRRGAAVNAVRFYALSPGFASQRRRQDTNTVRVHTWLPIT